jgi:endonuclease/exonuclease/phosphatase family metal-dependent hydrolase
MRDVASVGHDIQGDVGIDGRRGDPIWNVLAVACAVVVTLELARGLFSVGYHLADRIGWIPGGMLVVASFAAPIVTPAWSRLAGRWALPAVGGALIAARLAIQVLRPIPYWLAALGTVVGLVLLCELVCRNRPLVWGVGLIAGVAADTSVRSLGATWDVPWRSGVLAWILTAAVLIGLTVGLAGWRRQDPSAFQGSARGRGAASIMQGVLLGPLLYLTCFYTQSPAFLASSGHVSLAWGVLMALVNAVLAGAALVAGVGRSVPDWAFRAREWLLRYPAGGAVFLAVSGVLLPVVTGVAVLVLAAALQVVAAAVYGRALRDGPSRGATQTAGAMAAGTLLFGLLTFVYQVGFLVKLPFPGRAVPMAAGALFALAQLEGLRAPAPKVRMALAGRGLAVLVVTVPLAVALSAPNLASATVPARPITVMTFNVNQAVRDGQLDLDEIARLVHSQHPDVVVLEEVGRGLAVSGTTDEAQWLERQLRMRYVWAPAGDNQLGNLVLTRLPILDHSVLNLGKGAGTQARSAAFVRLDLGGGADLLVIGAHLQNGGGLALHATRAAEYQAILSAWDGQPRTVLLGDLNTYPGWPELGLVTAAGFHTTQNTSVCTMPTSNRNCPDWIFASGDLALSAVHVTVDRPDHRPLVGLVGVPFGGQQR